MGSATSQIHTSTRSRAAIDCARRAGLAAAALRDRGHSGGQRMGLLLRNDIEFVEVSIAIGAVGGVPVPINWHWVAPEIAHVIGDARLDVLFVHTEFLATAHAAAQIADAAPLIVHVTCTDAAAGGDVTWEQLIAAAAEPLSVDDALSASTGITYTSGTTGLPRGVTRPQQTLEQRVAIAARASVQLGITPGSTMLIPGPLYHSSPGTMLRLGLAVGANIVLMDRFDPRELLRLVARYRVQHVKLVPTMAIRLLDVPVDQRAAFDVSSLTHVVHSAAPCPHSVKRELIAWFGDALVEYYGCSEAGVITWITARDWLTHPGSVGLPGDGAAVVICNDTGMQLPPGERGHVYVRPASYWPRAGYLGAEHELDEFLDVGDTGYVDQDGYLYLTGRSAEIVISGGVNIYPVEIELALIDVPGVGDAAVLGLPDAEYGERVVAFVTPDSSSADPAARESTALDPEELRHELSRRLARYKVPRQIWIVDDLGRDESGKVRKHRLRERALTEAAYNAQ